MQQGRSTSSGKVAFERQPSEAMQEDQQEQSSPAQPASYSSADPSGNTARKRAKGSHDSPAPSNATLPPTAEDSQEAKLKRQQMLNKAAQQRYRQRRKERQTTIESSLGQLQEQNATLQAQVMALQTALVTSSVHTQQKPPLGQAPLLLPGLGLAMATPLMPGPMSMLLQPQEGAQEAPVVQQLQADQLMQMMALPQAQGTAPSPHPAQDQNVAMEVQTSEQTQGAAPGRQLQQEQQEQQEQQQQQQQGFGSLPPPRPPVSIHAAAKQPEGQGDSGGDGQGETGLGRQGLGAPGALVEQYQLKLAALKSFTEECQLDKLHAAGDQLEPPLAARLQELVAECAAGCAAAVDISSFQEASEWPPSVAGVTSPAADAGDLSSEVAEAAAAARTLEKQRWLQVLAEVGLSDQQMEDLVRLRADLLDALGRCLADRKVLAAQMMCCILDTAGFNQVSDQMAGGGAPCDLAHPWQQQVEGALQRLGYVEGVAFGSLAVRNVLAQLKAGICEEGQLVRAFTLAVLTGVLSPDQAAIVMTRRPFTPDILGLANALHEIWDMVPRLGSICNPTMPTAAVVTAAAAAAGAAMKRGAGARAPSSGGAAARRWAAPDAHVPSVSSTGHAALGAHELEAQRPAACGPGAGAGAAGRCLPAGGAGQKQDFHRLMLMAQSSGQRQAAVAHQLQLQMRRLPGGGPHHYHHQQLAQQQQGDDAAALNSFYRDLMGDGAVAGAAGALPSGAGHPAPQGAATGRAAAAAAAESASLLAALDALGTEALGGGDDYTMVEGEELMCALNMQLADGSGI